MALDDKLEQIIFDTGKSSDLSNLGVVLPINLEAFTRYYWQVSVWGDNGEEAVLGLNWFETGHRDAK